MKTSILSLFALTISAALAIPVQAGGRGGGGGGGFGGGHFAGGHSSAPHYAPARGGVRPSFQSGRNFSGNRMIYSGSRFSSTGVRQRAITSNGGAFAANQFAAGNTNRGNRVTRSSNPRNQAFANVRGTRFNQARRGNNLPSNWRSHVFARHEAGWHRDWDRGREHWWHGHRCRFIDGSWVIFDFGFYPWWSAGYPGYYAYDYYPYGSAPYGYDSYGYDPVYPSEPYYDQNSSYDPNGYESSEQNADSIVAAAQQELARQGYYRGQIDAVLGPGTRRAIERYQRANGLRVTGYLTADTLHALGLEQVASN